MALLAKGQGLIAKILDAKITQNMVDSAYQP